MKYYTMTIFTTDKGVMADPIITQHGTKDAALSTFHSKVSNIIADKTIVEGTVTWFDSYQNQLGREYWKLETE